jgi:hypothetical protein
VKRERIVEGKERRSKVKEVDENGRSIRERNVGSSGRVDKTHRRDKTGVGRKKNKWKGVINTA